MRILDLTRVIAGPTCTRLLAAFGADVLRIDPVGFAEVPALVPDTTVGKHCAALDLRRDSDHAQFERLVAEADVVVVGYRPGALAGVGFDLDALRALNARIVIATLDAYGWAGPWQDRRGFDSLVQMSCGIAAAGRDAKRVEQPFPLPAQALDHGTGYLLAAAIARGLASRWRDGVATTVHASLVGTANALFAVPDGDGLAAPPPAWTDGDTLMSSTEWGPARRVPPAAGIDGVRAAWSVDAGPLGRHPAAFAST